MKSLRTVYAHSILTAGLAFSAAPDGPALYKQRCAACHDAAPSEATLRMPKKEEIAKRTPQNIVDALTTGIMRQQALGLSDEEKRALATFLTGKAFDAAATNATPLQGLCTGAPPAISIDKNDWNGWGLDAENSRYQPNPGIKAADIPKLKLKWAFGFKGVSLGYSQPAAIAGRLFLGSADGTVYSLNANTGCIWWTHKAEAGVRSAPTLIRRDDKWLVLFGDESGRATALDAMTGKPAWTTPRLDDHPVARIAASLKYLEGRVYAPISSIEEVTGPNAKYECCKFRGSMVALDASSGKVLWKSHPITDPPKPSRKNAEGTQLYGPAGGAVWSSPTIDLKRKLLYFGTGNSYTDVETKGTNAIVAMDLETGSLKWIQQLTPADNFLVGCRPGKASCPEKIGPDFDFGSSPILRNLPGGKQLLLCGQKSGILFALDPDKLGEVVWQAKPGAGSALGGIQWGSAADRQNVYVAVSDIAAKPADAKPGISALRIADGKQVWFTPAPKPQCSFPTFNCVGSMSAAITAIPGAVFGGAIDGHFRAFSTTDGSILWDFDTGVAFETVNGVKAKGGSIDGAGPTIVNGMVYTNSGYGRFTGGPGNVLLAFSVDGK